METPTPHLVQLAAEGAILDRHYVHFTCSPSRASFLSGRLPVHVQTTLDNPEAPNSGIPRNMSTISSKLTNYYKAVVGKWDMGQCIT